MAHLLGTTGCLRLRLWGSVLRNHCSLHLATHATTHTHSTTRRQAFRVALWRDLHWDPACLLGQVSNQECAAEIRAAALRSARAQCCQLCATWWMQCGSGLCGDATRAAQIFTELPLQSSDRFPYHVSYLECSVIKYCSSLSIHLLLCSSWIKCVSVEDFGTFFQNFWLLWILKANSFLSRRDVGFFGHQCFLTSYTHNTAFNMSSKLFPYSPFVPSTILLSCHISPIV